MSVRKRTWRNRDGSRGEAWIAEYRDRGGNAASRASSASATPRAITPASPSMSAPASTCPTAKRS